MSQCLLGEGSRGNARREWDGEQTLYNKTHACLEFTLHECLLLFVNILAGRVFLAVARPVFHEFTILCQVSIQRANVTRGAAGNNTVGRNVFRHRAVGTVDYVVSNGYIRKYYSFRPNKHVRAN